MPELRLLVTIGLGVLLLVAATTKIGHPAKFRSTVLAYGVLPRALVRPTTTLIPAIELCVALALLTGVAVRAALLATVALLTLFCAAMALVLREGRHPDCGCGVSGNRPVGLALIGRNIILVALAGISSVHPPAGLRDVVAGDGHYASGNGVAAVLTLILLGVAVRVASEGRRTLIALSQAEPRSQ